MKTLKYILLFLLVAFGANAKTSSIDIWGVSKAIDTLEYKQMGPGIVYTRLSFPEYPLSVYMLTIDLNNPYNFIETFQAGDQLGKTEAMTSAYSRLSSSAHRTIAGVNGNFWVVSGQGQPSELLGVPYSGSMKNGEMATMPSSWNRGRGETAADLLQEIGFAVIDSAKKVWIDDMSFKGKVIIDGTGEFPISEINRIRSTNQIVVFNDFMGSGPTRSDDSGIEVFIKPKNGQGWKVNGDVECEVVSVVKDKGANTVNSGEYILSGSGTGRTFLENLSVGQSLKLNMQLFTRKDTVAVPARQMVTGNALVMKNGELTIRNTNEAYNSQLYPRTGIGMSPDRKKLFLIVIDKYGGSIGANTATMCGILKSAGASNATSMDGGGSAQMMLKGSIVNNPSDGKERAVANGWFVYDNTPDDNVITKIEFADYSVEIPFFASYTPVILGYNQYGALVNNHLKGFTLSCNPNIGSIKNDTTFVASGSIQPDLLTAHYNGLVVSKQVNIVPSNISFRLDSVLLDQNRKYSIEVLSSNGSTTMSINPAELTWTVSNPSICEITNGVLQAKADGTSWVFGSLGDHTDSLLVHVQTHDADKIIQDDFSNTAEWTLASSLSSWNAGFKTGNLPSGWTHGADINFTYQTARAPYLKLTKTIRFCSLPDTISFKFQPDELALSKIVMGVRPNDASQSTAITLSSVPAGKECDWEIPVSDIVSDASDLIHFPIWLDYITFYINASAVTSGAVYDLYIKELSLKYVNSSLSGIENTDRPAEFSVHYDQSSPSTVYVDYSGTESEFAYSVYTLMGQKISSGNTASGSLSIPLNASKGLYLLHLSTRTAGITYKIRVQ